MNWHHNTTWHRLLLILVFQLFYAPLMTIGSEPFSIPDTHMLKEAKGSLRNVISRASLLSRSPAQANKIAQQLLALRHDKSDPAEKWVLIETAIELLATSGNIVEAHTALEAIALEFRIDLRERKTDASFAASKLGNPDELLTKTSEMLDICLAVDDYECYERNADLGITIAGRLRNKFALNHFREAKELGVESKIRFRQIHPRLLLLKKHPNDPELNSVVGEHLCYWKNDWEAGLQHLAKATDAESSAIAAMELKNFLDNSEAIKSADFWLKEAGTRSNEREKTNIYLHAASILEGLLANDPLDVAISSLIEKRLSQLASILGIPTDGDVALHAKGAKVHNSNSNSLACIDGQWNQKHYTGFGMEPHTAIIELGQLYTLHHISFRLYDYDDRFFNYRVSTSIDGLKYRPLVDRSEGEWRSWQRIAFEPRLVKYIQIIGLRASIPVGFEIAEVIAK